MLAEATVTLSSLAAIVGALTNLQKEAVVISHMPPRLYPLMSPGFLAEAVWGIDEKAAWSWSKVAKDLADFAIDTNSPLLATSLLGRFSYARGGVELVQWRSRLHEPVDAVGAYFSNPPKDKRANGLVRTTVNAVVPEAEHYWVKWLLGANVPSRDQLRTIYNRMRASGSWSETPYNVDTVWVIPSLRENDAWQLSKCRGELRAIFRSYNLLARYPVPRVRQDNLVAPLSLSSALLALSDEQWVRLAGTMRGGKQPLGDVLDVVSSV